MLLKVRPLSRPRRQKAYLCVTDKLLHTLLKGHGLRHRSNSGLAHRSKAQLPSTEDLQNRLQGARLPYSPHVWKPKARPNPTQSRHMRKPAGVPFHCAKLGHKAKGNIIILAQWTHQAAHEGRQPTRDEKPEDSVMLRNREQENTRSHHLYVVTSVISIFPRRRVRFAHLEKIQNQASSWTVQ